MQRFTFSMLDSVGAYLNTYSQAASLLGDDARHRDAPFGEIAPHRMLEMACTCSLAPSVPDCIDWSQYGISELIDHVVRTHHPFLFAELGRLEVLVKDLDETLARHVHCWAEDLRAHMEHEEDTLFPLCRAMEANRDAGINLDPETELHGMYRGHENAEIDLVVICESVGDIANDSRTLHCVRSTLADIIADLHQHLELEDTVLLPAVLFERDLRATRTFRKSQVLRALQPKQLTQGEGHVFE